MDKKIARWLGVDLSTTALKLLVRSELGEIDLVSISMRGATTWKREPAHNLF